MTARTDEPSASDGEGARAEKDAWRRRLTAARRALSPAVREARTAALTAVVVRLASGMTGPVCTYLPVGTEPGSPALVEALRDAGHEVLLPVVPPQPGPLDWAHFGGTDELVAGPLGLRQPAGSRLGPITIARAGLVLVPALAADLRGNRLGRGGGYYDRTLLLATPGTPLVVVLNDEELVDELPAEPHDIRMTAALRPASGVTALGNTS